MARDLKKFVNPRFMKTVDLGLLRRLFERQPPDGRGGFDVGVFAQEEAAVREALQDFLMGPENTLPRGLVADLHHIAELGSENGMRILMEQAARRGVVLAAPIDDRGHPVRLEPKQVALVAFLDHEAVFNAASDLLALEARDSLTEFAGADEGVEPRLDEAFQWRFEQAARELFIRDLQGGYCRVGWYPDDDEINVVVTHGTAVTVTRASLRPISIQPMGAPLQPREAP